MSAPRARPYLDSVPALPGFVPSPTWNPRARRYPTIAHVQRYPVPAPTRCRWPGFSWLRTPRPPAPRISCPRRIPRPQIPLTASAPRGFRSAQC